MLMATKSIDFHAVEEHQREIDRRLYNWAKWCNGSNVPMTSPMFRMTPPPPRVRADMAYQMADSVDRMDAMKIAKAVIALPDKHRAAVNWAYVKPVNPRRACQSIGVSPDDLALLLRDGRQILINRKV
jgi:DNA-directed RNA polymerase specialized sigma24 family protein